MRPAEPSRSFLEQRARPALDRALRGPSAPRNYSSRAPLGYWTTSAFGRLDAIPHAPAKVDDPDDVTATWNQRSRERTESSRCHSAPPSVRTMRGSYRFTHRQLQGDAVQVQARRGRGDRRDLKREICHDYRVS